MDADVSRSNLGKKTHFHSAFIKCAGFGSHLTNLILMQMSQPDESVTSATRHRTRHKVNGTDGHIFVVLRYFARALDQPAEILGRLK